MKSLWQASLSVLVLSAIFLTAQVVNSYIPVWSDGHYTFPTLGKSFVIQNGVLEVLQSPQRTRTYGLQLTYDSLISGYKVPVTAINLVVFHNGLRNFENIDYTLINGTLKMLYSTPTASIAIDYDEIK